MLNELKNNISKSINNFNSLAFEILGDTVGKYKELTSLNKYELSLIIKDLHNSSLLNSNLFPVLKQMQVTDQYYQCINLNIIRNILNDIDENSGSQKMKVNKEILDSFNELFIFYKKQRNTIDFNITRIKYIEYLSLFEEKISESLLEINKLIEDLFSEVIYLNSTYKTIDSNDIFEPLVLNSTISNELTNFKIKILETIMNLLIKMGKKKKASFVAYSTILLISKSINSKNNNDNVINLIKQLFELLEIPNLTAKPIDSYYLFTPIHNLYISSLTKRYLHDVRNKNENNNLKLKDKDKMNFKEINTDFCNNNLMDIVIDEIVSNVQNDKKSELNIDNKFGNYKNEFVKKRLLEDQVLSVFDKNRLYKKFTNSSYFNTVHLQILYSYISLIRNDNFGESKLMYLNVLQSLNEFMPREMQIFLTNNLLELKGISINKNLNLLNMPILVSIIPLHSKISFDIKFEEIKKDDIFLYNPWNNKNRTDYYYSVGSYQNVQVSLFNPLETELIINKISLIFHSEELSPFSFPCKFLLNSFCTYSSKKL